MADQPPPPPPPPAPPPPPPPPRDTRTDDPPWPEDHPEWRYDAGDPEEAFPVGFTIFDALAMVVWTIVSQVLVFGGAVGVGAIDVSLDIGSQPVPGLAIQVVSQLVTLAGIAVWLAARGVLTWRLLGPLRPRARHVGIGVGLGVVGLVLVLTLSEGVNRLFGPFEAPEQFALQVSSASVLALVLAGVSAILLAPLIEELVFRSLLFQSIRRKLGLWAAMVIQALVFAYIHLEVVGSPPAVVGLVALALWLAGSFHRTGSLVVPVVAHATYNALVLTIQVTLVPQLPT